jgi:hypothetical protein
VKVTVRAAAVLPALSVARYATVCAPARSTTTGAVYARYGPPSSEYSIFSTPEPCSSVAVTVTRALFTYAPAEFFVPSTVTPVTGGVVSCGGAATTVNCTLFSAATLPALSVAR